MFRLLQILLNMFIWRKGIISIFEKAMLRAALVVNTFELEI